MGLLLGSKFRIQSTHLKKKLLPFPQYALINNFIVFTVHIALNIYLNETKQIKQQAKIIQYLRIHRECVFHFTQKYFLRGSTEIIAHVKRDCFYFFSSISQVWICLKGLELYKAIAIIN